MTRDQNELILVNMTLVLESLDDTFYDATLTPGP